ncbi:receptor-like protein 13 [Alnus glutinosa]|uniref:receptor-like protein 13 n=1 Tax=Alnus glutinosa TaxID=3517 RepID=UPI002D799507|nr:receptor-like protein 13 [Alnus glutinosa]
MEWAFVKALLWGLLVFLQFHGHTPACLQEERIALLKLKAFLQPNIIYANDHLLPSWIDDAKSDCCGWERVTCNSTTAHVIKLSLYNLNQDPDYYEYPYSYAYEYKDKKHWLLNMSLLVPLKELTTLNLSGNAIGGCLPNEGFEKLSSLRYLRFLDLSYNYFKNNSILQSLSAMASLETLNLTPNELQGYFPAQGGFESLPRLENLETLDLSYNNFNRSIIELLSAAKSLKNLNLASNGIEGLFPAKELLSAAKSLKNLNLASNGIKGLFPAKSFESLSILENLETLDLSSNYFNRAIFESLTAIKSLKNLNLAQNGITGSFPTQEISALENLEKLDLSYNQLNGSLTFQGLSNFSRLEILNLHENSFTGSISPYIEALSSLKAISLAWNKLNGTLPKELCGLKKLEELHLYGNFFDGILPPCLNNLTSLRLLDISENQFAGNISSSLIAIPTSLGYIDFSYNHFEGLFSFNLFANHSKLKVIILGSENNKFEIETEDSVVWDDLSFQLKIFILRNCSLNKLTGNIPKFLFDQHELEIIDLSHNKLTGNFPMWLLQNNTGLRELSLQNNSFVGKFHLPPDQHKSILKMDISDNCLDGQLQENIGKITPYVRYLKLSRNHFEGYLPSSISEMSHLEDLDLSFNNFSGELPAEFVANCTSLYFLKLCNNRFNGEFFSKHFKLRYLSVLILNNNQFTGTLPAIPLQWSLDYLDISNNNMSGTIPGWMVNRTFFWTFDVSNNSFEGQIPCGQVDFFQLLDLSHNSLSGSLPSCLNLQGVHHLLLQGNKLSGPIPKAIFNSSTLNTLNLRDNSFSGSIPVEIGALSNLIILLLRGNNFSGIIPNQMCWLNKIRIMDLSKNSLSETIPNCFHNMSFGKLIVDYVVYNEDPSEGWYEQIGSTFQNLIKGNNEGGKMELLYRKEINVVFVTKYRFNSYHGNILNYMSGLDLSCNKLTGRIPPELGNLSSIHALNLSYNQLTGSIPQTFSNLNQLESLDLSHNNLSGEIPSVLIDLNFLAIFTVAYNNLSGKVPDWKAQFATFNKSSYEGNPFLCGQPIENSCTGADESHPSPTKSSNASEGNWYEIDHQVFFASFTASYIVFFLGVATLLYIHPYWQQRCFNFIEDFKYCYYPVFDNLKRLSNRLYP